MDHHFRFGAVVLGQNFRSSAYIVLIYRIYRRRYHFIIKLSSRNRENVPPTHFPEPPFGVESDAQSIDGVPIEDFSV